MLIVELAALALLAALEATAAPAPLEARAALAPLAARAALATLTACMRTFLSDMKTCPLMESPTMSTSLPASLLMREVGRTESHEKENASPGDEIARRTFPWPSSPAPVWVMGGVSLSDGTLRSFSLRSLSHAAGSTTHSYLRLGRTRHSPSLPPLLTTSSASLHATFRCFEPLVVALLLVPLPCVCLWSHPTR